MNENRDEKLTDCIERQRAVLRQLSVFRDERKTITISLGDLRLLCDEITRLEEALDLAGDQLMGEDL